jgi:integrase
MARGKGLYKRGAVWWIRYAGPDGKIRRESSGSGNFKVAEAKLMERRKATQEGKDPTPVKRITNITFKELAEQYLPLMVEQKAFRSKAGFVKNLVDEFGGLPLRRFGTMLVEEYRTRKLTEGKKPATVNRHLATLKHMLRKAADWELIDEETLRRVRRVKQLHEDNRRLRYLSVEECRELIKACSLHLRSIVITALNTGMRKEEILSLEWEKHIDLRHGFILLDKTKNGERRQIPITPMLRETLQRIVRRIVTPYVFVDREGRRFKDTKTGFNAALRRAGIKDFRFHDLRHTFASHLVMGGVDLATIKDLLGHKDFKMTLRYAHLAPAHKTAALAILDSACCSTVELRRPVEAQGEYRKNQAYENHSPEVKRFRMLGRGLLRFFPLVEIWA